MAVTEFLWLELIWMIDWWAGIKVFLKFDPSYAFIIIIIFEVLSHLRLTL